jgi:hypothetical protein
MREVVHVTYDVFHYSEKWRSIHVVLYISEVNFSYLHLQKVLSRLKTYL